MKIELMKLRTRQGGREPSGGQNEHRKSQIKIYYFNQVNATINSYLSKLEHPNHWIDLCGMDAVEFYV